MQKVRATFRNGRVELLDPVDWPDDTTLDVTPADAGATASETKLPAPKNRAPLNSVWTPEFFQSLHEDWGDEPFERPQQGELEIREEWLLPQS